MASIPAKVATAICLAIKLDLPTRRYLQTNRFLLAWHTGVIVDLFATFRAVAEVYVSSAYSMFVEVHLLAG